MLQSVVITGFGAVVPPALDQLLKATDAHNDLSAFGSPNKIPEITLFDIPDGAPEHAFEIGDFDLKEHIATKHTFMDRTSALALAAAAAALKDAQLLDEKGKVTVETGCCYGTAFGCLDTMKLFSGKIVEKNPKFAPPFPFTHSYPNSPSALLAIEFGLKGHSMTFAGGNGSGMMALDAAFKAIQSGMADRIAVIASDALVQPLYMHFLSEEKLASIPESGEYPDNIDGIVLGEGSAALILESEKSAANRPCRIYGRMTATAFGTDPDGNSVSQALKTAYTSIFSDSGSQPVNVDVIQLSVPQGNAIDNEELDALNILIDGADQPNLASVKKWGGEMMSAVPLIGIGWSIKMFNGLSMTGLYRTGTRESIESALIQTCESNGTASVALITRIN